MSSSQPALKVLVVEDESDIQDIIGFVLESHMPVELSYASTGNKAIELIQANQKKQKSEHFDLIICDYNMPDGNGGDVFLYLVNNKISIPYVLCSSDDPSMHEEFKQGRIFSYAEKPLFQNALTAALDKVSILKRGTYEEPATASPGDTKVLLKKEYLRVQTRLLKSVHILPNDFFIRLSDDKFVKVFQSGDFFTDADYVKYLAKNVEFFYLERSDLAGFFDKLIKEVIYKRTSQHVEIDLEDSIQVLKDVMETIHDLGQKLGYTPEFEKMISATMDLTLKIANKNPALSLILSSLNLKDPSYRSAHSLATSFIACWISTRMGWQSDQTFRKLCLASMLHDICLKNHDLSRIQELKELEKNPENYSHQDIQEWKEHSQKAAQIAKQFTEIPPDVDTIIYQHHEKPYGDGMPLGINHTRMSPLSALFIIAHEVVYFFEKNPDAKDLQPFLMKFESKYNIGHFKRIIEKLPLKLDS